MARSTSLWTWDVGDRKVDFDAEVATLAPILETVLEGGLWKQFRKFPPDTLRRLLPHLRVPAETRRLIELWIEEAPHRTEAQR